MTTFVHFRTGDGEFAVDVDVTRGVRSAEGMVRLPAPQDDVVGLLPGEGDPLTVIAALGSGTNRVLVLDAPSGVTFGLLVEEVRGVVTVPSEELGPPPPGQAAGVVAGVFSRPEGLVLLVDAAALARMVER